MIKEKTCCFSGHRILPASFDIESLKKLVYRTVNDGFDTFLCGMAIGFDAACFKVLEEVKEANDIKIIACVPCNTQSKFFNKKQKKEYERMISKADEVVNVADDYYDGCMMDRNVFMVDNSSRLICYLNYGHGGTYSTVKYAAESGIEVIYFGKE